MGPRRWGDFLGCLLPSPCRLCLVRGCHFGGDCHRVVPVGAERAEQSRAVRAYRHLLPLLLTGMTLVLLNGFRITRRPCMWRSPFWGEGCAYFLRRAANLLLGLTGDGKRRSSPMYDSGDLALVASSGWWWSPSLGITFGGVSWGRMLLVLLVLTCARLGGVGGGTVARGGRWGDSGAFHGRALLPLRGLRPGQAHGGGVLPIGKLATAVALSHRVASCGGGGLSGDDFAGRHRSGRGHHPIHGAARSQRLAQLFGVARDTLAAGPCGGTIMLRLRHAAEGPRPGAYLGGERFPSSPPSAPNLQGCTTARWRPSAPGCSAGGLLAQAQRGDPGKFWPAGPKPCGKRAGWTRWTLPRAFLERCGRSGEMRDEISKNYGRYLIKERPPSCGPPKSGRWWRGTSKPPRTS